MTGCAKSQIKFRVKKKKGDDDENLLNLKTLS